MYLNHLLTYVRDGLMPDLTNRKLAELGARLEFYDGIPEFLDVARDHVEKDPRFQGLEITVEHYVVSTGMRQMILGSGIADEVKDVWGCEFIETPAPPGYIGGADSNAPEGGVITQLGYVIDNTTKTRAIWEINKGCNVFPDIDVNATIAPEDRRVPLVNMLYIADGPSDIPVFSILNHYGGRTLGVYNAKSEEHFRNVKWLSDQGRVQHFVEADYRENSAAYRWILQSLHEMAEAIVEARDRAFADRVQPPSGHVI
jgi:hypothetical protein